MPGGMDFALRPVARGWCRYESLKDGSLDLIDLADMNDGISVMDENSRRLKPDA